MFGIGIGAVGAVERFLIRVFIRRVFVFRVVDVNGAYAGSYLECGVHIIVISAIREVVVGLLIAGACVVIEEIGFNRFEVHFKFVFGGQVSGVVAIVSCGCCCLTVARIGVVDVVVLIGHGWVSGSG